MQQGMHCSDGKRLTASFIEGMNTVMLSRGHWGSGANERQKLRAV